MYGCTVAISMSEFSSTRLQRPLLQAVGCALLSALSFGLNNGMLNSPAAVIRADLGIPVSAAEGGCNSSSTSTSDSGDTLWSVSVSIFCLGALVGCNLWAPQADRLGRRKFLALNACIYIVGGVISGLSKLGACAPPCSGPSAGIGALIAGRAVSGLASGASTVVVPVYLGELSPAAWRGVVLTAFQLACTVSMTAAQVLGLGGLLGTPAGYPYLLASPVLVSAFQLAAHGWLLESPKFLEANGLAAEARRVEGLTLGAGGAGMLSGAGLRSEQALRMSTLGADEGTTRRKETPLSVRALLAQRRWRQPLSLVCVVMVVQQLSGINNAFNYGTSFLEGNGVEPGVVTAVTVLMNLTNVAVTCLAAWLMDRAGRRPLLIGSSLGMAGCIASLTVALSLGQPVLVALSVVAFVGCFGIGQGPVPWMLPTEV